MFKKLKDKLTEEVKIPSQKFTQSMQQLAQAVVSPSSSNNSTIDTASNDNFSIDGDFDDTPQGSPVKPAPAEGGVAYRGGQATPIRNSFDAGAGFTHVDLQQDTGTPKMPASLRSSVNSLASDSSFMFPVLESSGPTYNFQSDLESCSEASESVGPNINKEQILIAYQKIQQKYHKYKGRYADLARHYRDLERDNKNAKDKALRRMAELKEQCTLEKQAKAHLEEALRSDLEEKDHLIHTLKTKIKLLRNQADNVQAEQLNEKPSARESIEASEESSTKSGVPEDLLTGNDNGPGTPAAAAVLTPEPANVESDNALKEKVKKLESLLHKCKEDITNKRESIKQLESDKHSANAKIETLQKQLTAIQKREEEASLSLAKNKQTIHQELESKEEEIKKLNAQLSSTNSRVSELQTEILQLKEESKKEVAASKVQAMKAMKTEIEGVLAEKKTLEDLLASREGELKDHEEKMAELQKRLEHQETEHQLMQKSREETDEKYVEETKLLKEHISRLETCQKSQPEEREKIAKIKALTDSLQELQGIHKQLKIDATHSRVETIGWINEQAQLIQKKIEIVVGDLTEERKKILSELEEYKRESVNARESLASVSDKFARLQQSLSSEKGVIASKISELNKEAALSEKKICTLEQSLESERSNHQEVKNEYSQKLAELKKELDDERSRNKEAFEGSSSLKIKMQSTIDDLRGHVHELEQEKAKIVDDCERLKKEADILFTTTEQLKSELEILKTRDRESMNEMTSMQMLLNEKNAYVETLESSISEFQSAVDTSLAEKHELEQKWNTLEAKLTSQISEMERKHQEASNVIRDLQEKELRRIDDSDGKLTSVIKENEEKQEQIVTLQKRLQSSQVELENTITENTELQNQLSVLTKKHQDQESEVSTLKQANEVLSQSVQQMQDDHKEKAVRIKDLESSSVELERITTEKLQQSSHLAKFEMDLQMKTEECETIREKLQEANTSCLKLQELLSSKADECSNLSQKVDNLCSANSEQSRILHEKLDDCKELTSEIAHLKTEKSQLQNSFEQKTKECESLRAQLSNIDESHSEASEELDRKSEECNKLRDLVSGLENEKLELAQAVQAKNLEEENNASELQSLRQAYTDLSDVLQERIRECSDLSSKLEMLTAENERTNQQLKQKVLECDEKESQLDNLADEMKRVEELSQELHRINDDRDANVEVLSSEASSLAQKVEELTITTQELKEREVNLLAKLQVAQDLEKEYISMKHREELLLSELKELKVNEEELSSKTKQIEDLTEENKRLKEAGQNLDDIINRAREAESKCEKLRNDGADLLLRIQKAEESEIRCSLLEQELDTIKKQNAELSQEVQMLQSQPEFKGNPADIKSPVDAMEPVIEEPCVVKHFADLTENDSDDWKAKYNQLLEQHHMALQENAATIERLKEENLLAGMSNTAKKKERLWDQHEPGLALPDGTSNGSFGTVEKLQQQLATVTSQLKESKKVHRQEVDDLRRILLNHGSSNSHSSSRSDNLEDATELEYLRNILFEYMMGKEPMILARVIAAVVKFDSEQTSKVLQKEQQRLSLLGHLGIS